MQEVVSWMPFVLLCLDLRLRRWCHVHAKRLQKPHLEVLAYLQGWWQIAKASDTRDRVLMQPIQKFCLFEMGLAQDLIGVWLSSFFCLRWFPKPNFQEYRKINSLVCRCHECNSFQSLQLIQETIPTKIRSYGFSWLVLLVRQKLARQHNIYSITLGVGLSHDVHRKVNSAHDAVTKLLVDQLFDRGAVYADDFVPAIN